MNREPDKTRSIILLNASIVLFSFAGLFGKWIDLPVVYERTEVKEMTIEEISEALGYEVKVVK